MQVESLLVSNNGSCLTTNHHLEPSAVAGLGDRLESLGKGFMTDWPSTWQQQQGSATLTIAPAVQMSSDTAAAKTTQPTGTQPELMAPPPQPAEAACASCCHPGANGPADAALMDVCQPFGTIGASSPVAESRKQSADDMAGVQGPAQAEDVSGNQNREVALNGAVGRVESTGSGSLPSTQAAQPLPSRSSSDIGNEPSAQPATAMAADKPADCRLLQQPQPQHGQQGQGQSEPQQHSLDQRPTGTLAAEGPSSQAAGSAAPSPATSGPSAAPGAAAPAAAAGGLAADALTMELSQIVARCGGVSDTRFAGRLSALVEGEERLGGRLTLLSVVQQSSQEVLRLFIQGTGLRSLEQWVIQFRDEGRLPALIKVIGCLKMLPIDLTALKGSSIGQTVGKLRKHTNPPVRAAASELVDQWKGVVDRSVAKGETRQGTKSKADTAAQDGPNKRARKSAEHAGSTSKHGDGHTPSGLPPASTSKLAVMDDDLLAGTPASSGGAGTSSHAPGAHRPMGLTSFITGAKKVHAVKLENVIPGRLGSAGGSAAAAAAGQAPSTTFGAGGDGATAEDGSALPSPTGAGTSTQGPGSDAATGGASDAAGGEAGPESPKPNGGAAAGSEAPSTSGSQPPSLLPPPTDGTSPPSGPASSATTPTPLGAAVGPPKAVALPRLGTLAGPSTPTVRLGSLRDGSLPTSGIARLGAAPGVGGGVGGRVGAAASLPAAVAPGGPQSAHARAMAARARAPSPEPMPRKEKRKTVSWAGDELIAACRLFKKDDPPQLASTDAVLSAEDEAAASPAGDPAAVAGGGGTGGVAAPPGFQSAARREHASERMALIAQHEQEEQERQQELERWTAMRPTVPWSEPPELYLGAASPQQLPALGEDSTEREAQARMRQHTPKVVYYSPTQIPPSPAEPPPEPEPDPYRVRHIPLNVPGVGMPPVGAVGPLPLQAVGLMPPPGSMYSGGQPQPGSGPGGPHSGLPPPPPQGMPPYGGQLPPPGQQLPGPPPPPGMSGAPQGPPGPPPQQQLPPGAPQPGPGLSLPPDLVASLPALINTLSQQQQQQHQQPGLQQQQQPGPQPGQVPPCAGPGPGGLPGQGPQPGMPGPPPPPHVLPPPHQQHPHGLPHPHARMVGGPPPPAQQGPQPSHMPPGGPPIMGPGYSMPPPTRPGMGPGSGPGPGPGPSGPGRPGSRFEQGPGGAGGPPPPPPRKEGQPTLMRPRRTDDPPGGPGGPPHPHMGMGPPHGGMRHPPPHGHPHIGPGMGPQGGGNGPGLGGWAPPPGPDGGTASGRPPPPPGHGPGPGGPATSTKVCAYFNTPGGCRNGENCRFLHISPQDAGQPYDNGPFTGPGRGGMGMGRPGGPPPQGGPGGVRRR